MYIQLKSENFIKNQAEIKCFADWENRNNGWEYGNCNPKSLNYKSKNYSLDYVIKNYHGFKLSGSINLSTNYKDLDLNKLQLLVDRAGQDGLVIVILGVATANSTIHMDITREFNPC